MAQGCMGTEQQTRRSKRGNQRQYSHDDEDIELAAKEEDDLKLAIERSKRKDRERAPKDKATPAESKSGSESQGLQKEKRPDKGENCIEFDPAKNSWHKTLVKARRVISKLATEQHIMETFCSIDQSRSRIVKQQQELNRCKDAVQRCWDGVRDCILSCENVEGHRQIPEDHYDEHEELAAEHIVCCSCGNEEADDDNDILLCDGHGCSRAYHVQCLPFKDDFILQDLLDSEDGWLCPACDCRYDILWALAQTLDLEFEQLTEQSAEQVVATHNHVLAMAKGGIQTILEMDWPSSDEDDGDFAEGSDDDNDAGAAKGKAREGDADVEPKKKSRRVGGASTSKANGQDADSSAGCSKGASEVDEEDEEEEEEEDSDEVHVYLRDENRNGHNEEEDDDNYESDDLDEGEGKLDEEGLRRLEEDQKALLENEGECEVVVGKRKRQQVDYAALNASMFGDFESYEGEGSDDNYET